MDEVRKITRVKKVGHAGTLDPFAEGLLIILVGREETRKQAEFMGLDKTYEATFVLGEERDTDDITGRGQAFSPAGASENGMPDKSSIMAALNKFTGEIEQIPSTYSAKKINGKKAYELARKGEAVELKPKKVTIYELDLIDYAYPELKIRTKVSSGTYIRALARDIGRELGTGAYVKELKRTEIGNYKLENAKTLDELEKA